MRCTHLAGAGDGALKPVGAVRVDGLGGVGEVGHALQGQQAVGAEHLQRRGGSGTSRGPSLAYGRDNKLQGQQAVEVEHLWHRDKKTEA